MLIEQSPGEFYRAFLFLYSKEYRVMAVTVTRNGYEKLRDELNNLKRIERPRIIEAIAAAREHGDLSENAEYHAARERQSHIETRIQELESMIANIVVIDTSMLSGDHIMFGATVTIVNEDTGQEHTYTIVSEYESDIAQGLLSNISPLGRELIGKTVGDSITVRAPGGERHYEVLSIEYQ